MHKYILICILYNSIYLYMHIQLYIHYLQEFNVRGMIYSDSKFFMEKKYFHGRCPGGAINIAAVAAAA